MSKQVLVYKERPGSEDRLLRASEVQRELGVSRATTYRMMNDGTLPAYRFGGRNGRRAMVRVSLKELHAWIAADKVFPANAA
jgi:excisionase family DNA binding protein